jgi:hypothetical protein
MAKYKTESGVNLRIDVGNNTFINGKCVNPLKDSTIPLKERALAELSFEPVEKIEEKVVATGHVPNFTYGQGDDVVHVNTGHEAW